MELNKSIATGLHHNIERPARAVAAGSFAVDLLSALDTSGLTALALTVGLTSFGLRKILETNPTPSSG